MLCASFAQGRITVLRRTVSERASSEGLTGRRLEDFVVAVNEITTNAVLHGGGGGRLRMWWQQGRLWCEVADDGPGLPRGWSSATPPPSGFEAGGRGLWLTRLLCDHLTIVSGPGGTRVSFAAAR
ncbi:ATP-binding protein [Nonomuraea sp. LPB2021202275-12-8]|uniref:ATP-binding protein n=1 Tax=Nonomuraea sp. LPB2021202275-12-8 TaxID=3120159 RepID=UPI00300DBCB6